MKNKMTEKVVLKNIIRFLKEYTQYSENHPLVINPNKSLPRIFDTMQQGFIPLEISKHLSNLDDIALKEKIKIDDPKYTPCFGPNVTRAMLQNASPTLVKWSDTLDEQIALLFLDENLALRPEIKESFDEKTLTHLKNKHLNEQYIATCLSVSYRLYLMVRNKQFELDQKGQILQENQQSLEDEIYPIMSGIQFADLARKNPSKKNKERIKNAIIKKNALKKSKIKENLPKVINETNKAVQYLQTQEDRSKATKIYELLKKLKTIQKTIDKKSYHEIAKDYLKIMKEINKIFKEEQILTQLKLLHEGVNAIAEQFGKVRPEGDFGFGGLAVEIKETLKNISDDNPPQEQDVNRFIKKLSEVTQDAKNNLEQYYHESRDLLTWLVDKVKTLIAQVKGVKPMGLSKLGTLKSVSTNVASWFGKSMREKIKSDLAEAEKQKQSKEEHLGTP